MRTLLIYLLGIYPAIIAIRCVNLSVPEQHRLCGWYILTSWLVFFTVVLYVTVGVLVDSKIGQKLNKLVNYNKK